MLRRSSWARLVPPIPQWGLESSQTGQVWGNSALGHSGGTPDSLGSGVAGCLVSVPESATDSLKARVSWAHVGHNMKAGWRGETGSFATGFEKERTTPYLSLAHFNVRTLSYL